MDKGHQTVPQISNPIIQYGARSKSAKVMAGSVLQLSENGVIKLSQLLSIY